MSPYLEGMIARLDALDGGYQDSAAFFEAVDRLELLEPFSLDVTLDNGAEHRMVGYHLVNERRLQSLDAATLGELHTNGHLEPLFMARASVGNLAKLVQRKNRRLAHG